MKKIFYSLVLFVFANTAQATGPRVTSALLSTPVNQIFALDFPLVLSADSADGGIAGALITAAFQNEKTESTITPLPLQTMVTYYLNEENALAVVGHDLNLNAAQLKNVIVIPVVILKESYFYSRQKHEKLTWSGKLDDFKNLTLGLHKGDVSEPYQKFGIKTEQERLDVRIKSLIDGKIDLLRESDLTMLMTLDKNFNSQKDTIIRLEPRAGEAVISIAFNKKNPDGATLAKRFQQGLKTLVSTGKYNEIIKTHIGNMPIEQYFLPLKN